MTPDAVIGAAQCLGLLLRGHPAAVKKAVLRCVLAACDEADGPILAPIADDLLSLSGVAPLVAAVTQRSQPGLRPPAGTPLQVAQ